MKKTLFYISVVSFLCFLLFSGCRGPERKTLEVPSRIVSLAPSITETLFALGLGERVVGVTRYCGYPERAASIEKIGGYTDISIEKVISLEPDLVILQPEHKKQKRFFNRYGIETLVINNITYNDICSSFVLIGRVCGAKQRADSLLRVFSKETEAVETGGSSPVVMVSLGRGSPGSKIIRSAFIAGRNTFYNGIIEAAGGTNAFTDTFPSYPKITREGIISMGPDIIIELVSPMNTCSCEDLAGDWQSLEMVPAVRNRKVFCISEDYATIPGPRILSLIRDFKSIFGAGERSVEQKGEKDIGSGS